MANPVIKHIADSVRELSPYQPGRPIADVAAARGIADVIKLASNENPLGPGKAALSALRDMPAAAVSRYPDSNSGELRQALSRRLQIAPEQLLFGNGSNDIIELAAQLLLRDGRTVVFSQFAFVVYDIVSKARQATLRIIPARDFQHDLAAMAAAAKAPEVRLVFVANPNNPTGSWHPPSAIRDFLSKIPPDVLVVVDEAYCEYLPEDANSLPLLADFPNLLITRTFSKIHGLAGLRAGYGIADGELVEMINRIRQPFNFNAAAQITAVAALSDKQHIADSRALNFAGRRQIESKLQDLKLQTMKSFANFVPFAVAPPFSSTTVCESLLDDGVIVRDLASYQLHNWLRVSIGREGENARFLRSLGRALQR